jgi:hypothetical protein
MCDRTFRPNLNNPGLISLILNGAGLSGVTSNGAGLSGVNPNRLNLIRRMGGRILDV